MKEVVMPNNENTIKDYKTYLELRDLKSATIDIKCFVLIPFFRYLNYKKAEDMTKKDIEEYFIYLKRSKKKKTTQMRDFITIRAFFKWLKPGNNFFENIKIKKEKPDTSKKEYANVDDVKAMLPYCINQRDRVLLLLMWESGSRLGELLSLNVCDVKPQKYGVTVTVTGKTGKRDILIIDSVPDIQQWLNIYQPSSPDAPLFPILGRHRKGRLQIRGAQSVIKKLAKDAGIKKNIHCHSFRHGRLTELSNSGLTEMQLRIFAGWTKESEMPAVYLHTNQDDVFNKLLKIKGIETEETKRETVKVLSTKTCPRCNTSNAFDAKYCKNCSMILDPIMAANMEKDAEDLNMAIMKAISMNPAMFDELNRRIKTLENNKN